MEKKNCILGHIGQTHKGGKMVLAKLYVKDVKKMVDFKYYGADVFKSGMFVKLWCRDKNYEDELIDLLHKMNFRCIPDKIPSNGFYTLQYFVE